MTLTNVAEALFSDTGSIALDDTEAALALFPRLFIVCTIVIPAVPCIGIEPRLQVTNPPEKVHEPWLAVAETYVAPVASGWLTVTRLAVAGP